MTSEHGDCVAALQGNRVGFGESPALLVIDLMRAFTDPSSQIYGRDVVGAVAASQPLLAAARRAGIPVIFTQVRYHPTHVDAGLMIRKAPSLAMLIEGEPLAEIDPLVAPRVDELVIAKYFPSCFFGTRLDAMLKTLGVDTTIIIGATTSGCVRSAATDAIQHGYRVIVPRECVGDRCPHAHAANLTDIDARYGDVMGRDEVIAHLETHGYGGEVPSRGQDALPARANVREQVR